MRNKLLLFSVAILTAFGLSACGQDAGTSTTSTQGGTSSEVTSSSKEATSSSSSSSSSSEATSSEETSDDTATAGEILPLEYKIRQTNQYKYDDRYETDAISNMEYDSLLIDEEKYPALEESIEKLNDSIEEMTEKDYKNATKMAKSDLKNNPEYFSGPYSVSKSIRVTRNDSEVLSLWVMDCGFTGGAHGYYSSVGHSYSVTTGEELMLDDIIADKKAFIEVIENRLDDEYPNLSNLNDPNKVIKKQVKNDQLCWTLTNNGISILFNVYELASYAEGAQSIDIYFDDEPELFTGDYQNLPEAYAVELYSSDVSYVDLDGDGVRDEISIMPDYETVDDYSYLKALDFDINGKYTVKNVEGDNPTITLMHMGDNENYIYVDLTTDNDYHLLYIYEIYNNKLRQVMKGNTDYALGAEVDEDDNNYEDNIYSSIKVPITNPHNFRLFRRFHILSTSNGYMDYTVGSNGKPEPLNNLYVLTNDIELTLLQDLTLNAFDIETLEEGEEKTFEKGDKIKVVMTDAKDTIVFEDDDDNYYSVKAKLDHGNYVSKINDIKIEKLFDGMMFAG